MRLNCCSRIIPLETCRIITAIHSHCKSLSFSLPQLGQTAYHSQLRWSNYGFSLRTRAWKERWTWRMEELHGFHTSVPEPIHVFRRHRQILVDLGFKLSSWVLRNETLWSFLALNHIFGYLKLGFWQSIMLCCAHRVL